jgi:hypothetical protein
LNREIDRRLEAYRQDPSRGASWEEFSQRLEAEGCEVNASLPRFSILRLVDQHFFQLDDAIVAVNPIEQSQGQVVLEEAEE